MSKAEIDILLKPKSVKTNAKSNTPSLPAPDVVLPPSGVSDVNADKGPSSKSKVVKTNAKSIELSSAAPRSFAAPSSTDSVLNDVVVKSTKSKRKKGESENEFESAKRKVSHYEVLRKSTLHRTKALSIRSMIKRVLKDDKFGHTFVPLKEGSAHHALTSGYVKLCIEEGCKSQTSFMCIQCSYLFCSGIGVISVCKKCQTGKHVEHLIIDDIVDLSV